jgi:hypothetical protein
VRETFAQPPLFIYKNAMPFLLEILSWAPLFMGVLLLCIFWHQSTLIQDKHQLISHVNTHTPEINLHCRQGGHYFHFILSAPDAPALLQNASATAFIAIGKKSKL